MEHGRSRLSSAAQVQEVVTGFRMKTSDEDKKRIMRWHVIGGLCLQAGLRKGAEIGVSQGRFTMYLCALMYDMHMTAVDRWEEQPDHPTEGWLGWNHEGSLKRFRETCDQYFKGRVDIIRSDSVAAADGIEDGSLDFVFIDADHSYEGCSKDIKAWAPKVRQGGMVAGHDYNLKWPGVVKAVDEVYPKRTVSHDSVWVQFKT